MAKASFTLPDGTTVLVEGSVDEIQKIISLYSPEIVTRPQHINKKQDYKNHISKIEKESKVDISTLVNTLKSSDEIKLIEKNVLDRSIVIDRVLLPLYILHKDFDDKFPLTSGEISKIFSQLGITIFQSNVARTLSSTASKYVIGDKIRAKGQAVRYRLSRLGMKYISSVIKGQAVE
ncbi:MAG: hypothetical protein A2X99_05580 [Deltaproteobacteria bacterium GWB2_55_19]|nr:MAG: hypothetical protein A2X99_05580 [Deltaproteobacteria bacterium GWB2_55_19]